MNTYAHSAFEDTQLPMLNLYGKFRYDISTFQGVTSIKRTEI